MTKAKVSIIIDSGAFSAWRLGKAIDLEKYCDYLLANADWITHYVALDVINPLSTEAAAKASFDNLVRMRARGLRPIPVYHVGEDISWLFRMLDLGCDYIGLSASSLVSRNKVDDWYAWAWSHLVNSSGLPIVKAHAFGEGRVESLKRFPWYSADSTSWIYSAQRAGVATMPNGLKVAMRNDGGSARQAPDIESLSPADRAAFDAILKECGINKSVFDLRDQEATVLRSYLTALFYLRCQRDIQAEHPIHFHPQGFLHRGYSDKAADGFDQFNFYLVCGTNNTTFPILARLPNISCLASYFYIDSPDATVAQMSGYKFKKLREFVRDPIGTVQDVPTWLKYWQILEKHIHVSV